MFQQISRLNFDSILGLMARFRSDAFEQKVDLGVGVYRDAHGDTPVLDCVRRAEQAMLGSQQTKSYVSAGGREEFNGAVEELVLGSSHGARSDGRIRTVQAPGGCGALRVGAELIRAATPQSVVHVSDPTWGNHVPLLGSSGLRLQRYPYYDPVAHTLRIDSMLEHLERAAAGDVVLLHACCHNPCGADLAPAQWESLIEVMQRRSLVPFLDLAYQGFGGDLMEDVAPVRRISEQLPECLIATSYSKNMGLYRERVGALIVVCETAAQAAAAHSHVLQIARSIYSMPPDHGAAIAAHIFADAGLRESWISELATMRNRITDMRSMLAQHLYAASGSSAYDFIRAQRGMFSLLGVSEAVVDRLREHHHIYMTADSRMNIAGITPQNAAYVARSILAAREFAGPPD